MSVSYIEEPMWVHKVRLRCLKLAIQCGDTEGEVSVHEVIRRAEVMFRYVVVADTVPETVAELPAEVAATEPPPAP